MTLSRLADINDYEQIYHLIRSYDYIYGCEITKSGIKDNIINCVSDVLNKKVNAAIAITLKDDELTGFGIQLFYPEHWVVFLVMMKWKNFNPKNQEHGGIILNTLVDNAELLGYRKFYWASREENNQRYRRLNHVLKVSNINERYLIETLEIIPPMTLSKYEIVNKGLLCDVAGKNTKLIAIRQGTKK